MKTKKINDILKEVSREINPSKEDINEINESLDYFLKKIRSNIKKSKTDAEIFLGGSFAKNTMVKTKEYDIDIFIRFGKKHKDISKLTERLLKGIKKTKIHGSRDYFKIHTKSNFYIEVIPVMKVKNPREAENITDLSYSHVNYIRKKIKSEKILSDVRIAKVFCHASECYGAESYIRGFSGYGLELLVYYYKGFLNFIKAMTKIDKTLVIDIEKHFKNRQQVLMDLNESKLQSPIILIDPTYKNRNALAALSWETFEKFKKTCKEFLKNPNLKYFYKEAKNLREISEKEKKKGVDSTVIRARTEKQSGDIAGSKLLKFYRHLSNEISEYFKIKKSDFDYDGKNTGTLLFAVESKKEILIEGPKASDKKNVSRFKKRHKKTLVKKGRICSKEKIDFRLNEFLKSWKNKNKKKMKEMSIINIELIQIP